MTKVTKAAVPAPKKEGVRRKGEASNGEAKSRREKGLILVIEIYMLIMITIFSIKIVHIIFTIFGAYLTTK